MTQELPSECESCGAVQTGTQEHSKNCIRAYTKDGSCVCKPNGKAKDLNYLNYHGRKLYLCDDCFDKEKAILAKGDSNLHEYQKNIPDKIEHRITAELKVQQTVAKWQELYCTERTQWVVNNFESVEDMRTKLTEFILSMEKLEWEAKTKKRAAYDAAKELDTRLSKEERQALIDDPNFKVPTNSEFKKIAKDRELDEYIKTLGIREVTAKQRKSIQQLMDFGLSAQEIKEQMKL